LYKSDCRFEVPGQGHLAIKGMLKLPIKYRGITSVQKVYIAENQPSALLGKPAIAAFNLIRQVNAAPQATRTKPEQRYNSLFTGLRRLPGKYKITLVDNCKPFALTVPQRVPFPLLKGAEGVIVPIDKPTDWVSPMTVVYKNNKVCLCVDLITQLNQNVKREIFPIPPIEETLIPT
jgi:hypothetical protein